MFTKQHKCLNNLIPINVIIIEDISPCNLQCVSVANLHLQGLSSFTHFTPQHLGRRRVIPRLALIQDTPFGNLEMQEEYILCM